MVWPALLVRAPLRMTLEGVDSLGYRRGGEVARAPRVPPCIQRCRDTREGSTPAAHAHPGNVLHQDKTHCNRQFQRRRSKTCALNLLLSMFGTTVRLLS